MENDIHTTEVNAEFWKQHVEAWSLTGKSGAAYCKAHSLVYHLFNYWRQKFAGPARDAGKPTSTGFIPVRVESAPPAASLGILLPNGLRIDGVCAENIPLVRQLLAAL